MSEKWNKLLAPETFRKRSEIKVFDGRNPFENDYGRLISSSPIRRLQDKTQVFPLEQSDFIRTRLTHSLEVSYIASSIGQSIEEFLFKEKEFDKQKYAGHISSLLRVAGLVHDLGNPPFGHFGEAAIQDYFEKFFKHEGKGLPLSEQEKFDFIHFDGNVQTFRILRKLQFFKDEFSYNLTFPSLASIIKYPSSSLEGNQGKNASKIAHKKFGYFASEEDDYQRINDFLGLNNARHPIVYLLEAADDIAYSAADIEDGMKLGILNFEKIHAVFSKNLKTNKHLIEELEKLYKANHTAHMDQLALTVQQFRIKTQTLMIEGVLESFKDNYERVLNGQLEDEILEQSNGADIRKSFKALQYVVFDDKKIMQTEIAGWEAIQGLLSIFVPAILSQNYEKGNTREGRLYKCISSSYRHIFENYNKYPNKTYNKLQLVVDFISGMTDSYAMDLFRKLKGIQL